MTKLPAIRATDDAGVELNSDFRIETDGRELSLVLESAGGTVNGSPRPRNSDYVAALTLLLHRLSALDATLISAVVASARLSHLPEADRLLIAGPVALREVRDIDRLRKDITRPQGRIGLPEHAVKEGNNRKRIRLRVSVPGYGPDDAERLSKYLAIGDGPIPSTDPHFGELDGITQAKIRREQTRLRRLLSRGRDTADCALCGSNYPIGFLVAAHIKKRASCTDEERRDLHHSGRIRLTTRNTPSAGFLAERLAALSGSSCRAHNSSSEPYFRWHRENTFRP